MRPSPSNVRLPVAVCVSVLVAAVLAVAPATAGAADAPECQGHVATIWGTDDADVLEGTAGDDVIIGLGGRDTINGRGGDDIICGGGGGDTIDGGTGNDTIWGHGGHDTIKGGKGDDFIRSGKGNDKIWGNGGANDIAWAGSGSDTCIAEREGNCELDTRWGHTPDDWLPLLDEYFGDIGQTANARIVLGCESLGEPFIINPNTGDHRGLFQYRGDIWVWMTEGTVWDGETRFHPEASVATARLHYDWALDVQGYGFAPWVSCGCHPDVDAPGKPDPCPYKTG